MALDNQPAAPHYVRNRKPSFFGKVQAMRIAITGASGLVGRELVAYCEQHGDFVTRIVRGKAASDEIHWDPAKGEIDSKSLEGFDAVIHLAGENIAGRRWNAAQKARILDSRVQGTTLISHKLAALNQKPRVFLSASAIGYYGDRGDNVCDETTSNGSGFLADVCVAWEGATEPAVRAEIRVVNLRIGIVLSPKGGALQKMLLPFKLGAGGVVGSGRQFWSWIAIDDLIRTIEHSLRTDSLHGPVNAVAPHAVTNYDFTKKLGRVLHRPTIFPMPALMARAALGEMADALLLASTRVTPNKLLESKFNFMYPELEPALKHVLGKVGD
jgi:hypothetical protein